MNGALYEVNLKTCGDKSHDNNDVKEHRTFKAHDESITCITATCDASLLVTGSQDANVKVSNCHPYSEI